VILPNPYCYKITTFFQKLLHTTFSSADEATALNFKNMQVVDTSRVAATLGKYEYFTYPELI
jgi:hypothetical protein